ncbi:hypothetical protein [Candidatus Amoebophilus asiaticus]|uniref:hypothetical protein n=1 Tax=Candidatus Amoebophilus asiaticus TaxID=281120 RepID=UPI00164F6B01|nr:hypothetical protein [Candidatus Amoebophilus asiaticus]
MLKERAYCKSKGNYFVCLQTTISKHREDNHQLREQLDLNSTDSYILVSLIELYLSKTIHLVLEN